MKETDEQHTARMSHELAGKNIAQHQVLLDAYIRSRTGFDKSLLTLSSGGVALIVGLLHATSPDTCWIKVFYIIGLIAFGLAIIILLVVLRWTSAQLESNLRGEKEPSLRAWDISAIFAFGLGIVSVAVIGVQAAIS